MPLVELVRRNMTRTSAPEATSCRVTCDPRNPLAPITSFLLTALSHLRGPRPEPSGTALEDSLSLDLLDAFFAREDRAIVERLVDA